MEIRSVTLFSEPTFNPAKAANLYEATRSAFTIKVQTNRLALTPLPTWWNSHHFATIQARETVAHWQEGGADYISLGPVLLRHDAGWLNTLPEIIAGNDKLFVSAEIADTNGLVDTGRCQAMAGIIRRVSMLQADGFANLYMAVLAHCPAGSPFFPAGFHWGGSPHFALAVEAADLAVSAIARAQTLSEARQNLVKAIESAAHILTETAHEIAKDQGIAFSGIDFSLAPAPGEKRSIAAAFEALGLSHVGTPGSLFTAAFITDAIDRAQFRRCGFSGLFLPVLEDTILAQRAGDGMVTVSDLLTFSAVCGTGLDVLPLPGDIPQDALAGILYDLGALASRLRKPLTARLMPIPGLQAGDPVRFNFPYFADGRTMNVSGSGVSGKLKGMSRLPFRSIHEDTQ